MENIQEGKGKGQENVIRERERERERMNKYVCMDDRRMAIFKYSSHIITILSMLKSKPPLPK